MKEPISVIKLATWDRAVLEAKKRIMQGFKPTVMKDTKTGYWIVEVYE